MSEEEKKEEQPVPNLEPEGARIDIQKVTQAIAFYFQHFQLQGAAFVIVNTGDADRPYVSSEIGSYASMQHMLLIMKHSVDKIHAEYHGKKLPDWTEKEVQALGNVIAGMLELMEYYKMAPKKIGEERSVQND